MSIDKVRRRSFDPQIAETLHDKPLAGRVLAARGIQHSKEVVLPSSELPPPDKMADFATAVDLLSQAVQHKQSILIVGDYDADGATSTALAMLVLRACNADANYLVPNRFEYGYGLSAEIVAVALESKPDVILTVDNGIASHEGVAKAVQAGVTVVVTDHHLPPEVLPQAHAMVNPNRNDCVFPSKHLCGVGVIFYVMTGLCRRLQQTAWFESQNLPLPNMASYLDLVALGTVADVVPLDKTNRILVDQGVKRIRADATRPGIRALFAVAGRKQHNCMTQDLGFFIAPRLNAAGRLADMTVGVECLLATDIERATELAAELQRINSARRAIQDDMNAEAELQIEKLQLNGELPAALVMYEPAWHEGVIGIVAGKIKERFHRPVFAFAQTADGSLKGSGRSIAEVHIRDVLMEVAAARPDMLHKFGGHAMAAGLSLQTDLLQAFTDAVVATVTSKLGGDAPQREWLTDGALEDEELNLENAQLMQFLQPWGQSFEAPSFDDVFCIESVRIVGNNHSKMLLRRPNSRQKLPAIAFNRLIDSSQSEQWHAVYQLDVNDYNNSRSLQLVVQYIAPVQATGRL